MATAHLTPGTETFHSQTEAEADASKRLNDALMPAAEVKGILDGDGIRAGYKIEITFGPNRSSLKDYTALISLWESGKFFHGGGDASMYFCLDCRAMHPKTATKLITAILDGKETKEKFGCGYPIPGASMGGGLAICPHCQKPIDTDKLTGQVPFYGTTPDLAAFVARYFEVLKHNADIYCKYHMTDIRYKAMEKAKGLELARRLRGLFIYPVGRILKDTAAGATLDSRFRAFFNA